MFLTVISLLTIFRVVMLDDTVRAAEFNHESGIQELAVSE